MLMVTNTVEEPAVSTFKAEVPDVSPIQLKSTIHIAIMWRIRGRGEMCTEF